MIKEVESLFSLKDKVVVVTGATGVLGEAFINGLCSAEASIVVIGRNEDIAKQRVEEVINAGCKAIYIIADVLNEQDLIEANSKILKEFGRIDALVNAAGGNVAEAVVQPGNDVFDLNVSALKQAFDLNLLVPLCQHKFLVVKLPKMEAALSIFHLSLLHRPLPVY